MSNLLELLGRGLNSDLSDVLSRYFWSPSRHSLAELQREAEDHPDRPDAHCRLGVANLRAMKLSEGIESLSTACRLKPDYLAARLALAGAYDEMGQSGKAIEHLKAANLNHPGEVRILFALGFCCEKMQRPQDAAEYYRGALASDGSFLSARRRLAAVAVALDRNAEAIAQYEHLRDATPDELWLTTTLGQLYYREGKYPEAISCFQIAIAMEPENWSLLDDEVEALVAGGCVREAIDRLHRLIELQPSFPDLRVRLADLYSQVGDDDAAMDSLRRALELQPDYLEALIKTGTQHLAGGRWEQAAETLGEACELNDQSLQTYVGLGVAQLAAGQAEEAVESFELAAAMEPNSEMLLSEMARLQLKAAVADEYLHNFEHGSPTPIAEIELDNDDLLLKQIERHQQEVADRPGRSDVHYRYGVLLRSQGRLAEALEQFEQALGICPTYVDAVIKLGITQQEMGRTDEAIATFKKVLNVEPEYIDIHYRLGVLYTDRRLFDQAVRHMSEAVDGEPNNERLRAGLALSLQNMGLMDRAVATWRSLWQIHRQHSKS